MKNFGMLYWYELKKLLQRKLAWVMVLVLAGLMAYAVWPHTTSGYAHTFNLTDREGKTLTSSPMTAKDQREASLEGARSISGQTMDEEFFRGLHETVTGKGLYELEEYLDVESYFFLVDSSYHQFFDFVEFEMGLDARTLTAEQFYNERQNRLEEQWDLQGWTDGVDTYWRAMEDQVEKPFTYQSTKGWQNVLLSIYGISSILPLVVAVCLCGVFSEERHTRADALLFSSRKGRFPLYFAKVLAGATVALVVGAVVVGASVAAILLAWGVDGFGAALQLWRYDSSLPVTMGQAALIFCGLLLLYCLVSGGATMLISALTQSSIAAMAMPIVLMVGQAWLRLNSQAAEYLPNQLFNTTPSLRNWNLVNLFGTYWNNLQFAFLLYTVLAIVLTALCWLGWRRSAAGKG